MKLFWVGLLALGCGGGVSEQPTPVHYDLTVAEDWSPEQTEQILDAVDFWRGELGDWVELRVTIGPCDAQTPRCIAAVQRDAPEFAEGAERNAEELERAGDDLRIVGLTTHTAILLDRDFARLGDVARHELGHRLGLIHADGGVMGICVGSSEVTPKVRAHLELRGLR
jgi:hypothetical protein